MATSPYKRIIVNGYADPREAGKDTRRLWALSLKRAEEAVSLLQDCNVHPSLLEASGRGAYDAATSEADIAQENVRGKLALEEWNRRLELVVVYSGDISVRYLRNQQGIQTPKGVGPSP